MTDVALDQVVPVREDDPTAELPVVGDDTPEDPRLPRLERLKRWWHGVWWAMSGRGYAPGEEPAYVPRPHRTWRQRLDDFRRWGMVRLGQEDSDEVLIDEIREEYNGRDGLARFVQMASQALGEDIDPHDLMDEDGRPNWPAVINVYRQVLEARGVDTDTDEEDGEDAPAGMTRTERAAAKRRRKVWTIVGGLFALAAVIAVVWVSVVSLSPKGPGKADAKNGAGASQVATQGASQDASTSAPTAAEEVADFVIAMPKRDGHRLNADGVKVHDDAKAFRDQIAEQAMHDPLTLQVYYNFSPLGEADPIQNPADLCKDGKIQDGNVYSEEGKRRYAEWLTLWKVADIASVREITFQAGNTGVSGNTVTQSGGVSGNNKAGYDIKYKDAQGNNVGEHSALERCTQPTGGKHHFPEGPTDNELTPKDASQDVGSNPKVDDWKKDGGEKHTVTKGDGAKKPNGYQKDPEADAKKAAEKAAKKAAEEKAA
ncbi:hypothetical protein HGB25_01970, partial [Candidatus Saccharibacteria bacterium]|nr:hypothetical protein [Candidatus Saccharibacteria bacterium]